MGELTLSNEKQLDGNIKVFKIIETYQGHKDIVRDIVRKFHSINKIKNNK